MTNKRKNDRNFIGNAVHAETIVSNSFGRKTSSGRPISDVLISNHFASAYQCGSHMCSNERVTIFCGFFFFCFFFVDTFICCGCAFIVCCMVCKHAINAIKARASPVFSKRLYQKRFFFFLYKLPFADRRGEAAEQIATRIYIYSVAAVRCCVVGIFSRWMYSFM